MKYFFEAYMNINFYCYKDKRLKSNKEQYVYCYIRKEGKTLTLNTKIKTNPKFFDMKRQKFKKGSLNELELNMRIESYRNALIALSNQLFIEKPNIQVEELFETIKKRFKISDNQLPDVLDLYLTFIKNKEITLSANTIKSHHSSYQLFKSYFEFKNESINFRNINEDFLNNFESYLYEVKKYNISTVNKKIKLLKEFLRYLVKEKYISEFDFKQHKNKHSEYQTDIFVLSKQEIDFIADTDFGDYKYNKVRDMFVFSSYTGQRFSDVTKFSISNTYTKDGVMFWKIIQQKTSIPVVIQVNPKVVEIVERYKEEGFKISNLEYNKLLKEIGIKAGFVDEVTIYENIGKELVSNVYKKYELFTSHVARRSFITNLLSKGVNSELVKALSGHKSDNEFKKYIKFSDKTLSDVNNFEK